MFDMSDLYHIPNDDGQTYRLKKFVEYQHEVPAVDSEFLSKWVIRHKCTLDEAVRICWLDSVTYNEITSVFLNELYKTTNMSNAELWKRYGDRLLFGSVRKYVRYNGSFVLLMDEWDTETKGKPYEWLKSLEDKDAQRTLSNLENKLLSIKQVGRAAMDIFVEMVTKLATYLDFNIGEPKTLDWSNCANLTSGTYNIFYEDERANEYDLKKRVSTDEYYVLDWYLGEIQNAIRASIPPKNAAYITFLGRYAVSAIFSKPEGTVDFTTTENLAGSKSTREHFRSSRGCGVLVIRTGKRYTQTTYWAS